METFKLYEIQNNPAYPTDERVGITSGHDRWPMGEFWGRLEPLTPQENERDLLVIRQYLIADINFAQTIPGRTSPDVGRQVLEAAWEKPRLHVHRAQMSKRSEVYPGHRQSQFRGKKLGVPWSPEAINRFNTNHSTRGPTVEHVTPIKTLWACLKFFLAEYPNKGDWLSRSAHYLDVNYLIVVITDEQAAAINAAGFTSSGASMDHPYMRYLRASKVIEEMLKDGHDKATHFNPFELMIAGVPDTSILADMHRRPGGST